MRSKIKEAIRFRQYQDSDGISIQELNRLALEPTGAFVSGLCDNDLINIQTLYLQNGGDFIVGTIDSRVVCIGALFKKSETLAEIKRMRVHPDFQRQGFGQMVLTKLEEKARQFGYTALCLNTTTLQISAQKLYQKNGYREIGRGQVAHLEVINYEKKLI